MLLSRRRFFALLPAAFGLWSGLTARASGQTAPPTLDVTRHDSVSFSDTSKTLVDEWEVRVPQGTEEVTLQLWSLQNGHLALLQTTGAYFDKSETQTAQTGRVFLLRARAPYSKSGAATPIPGLGFRFPQSRKLVTTIGARETGVRPAARTSVSLPGPLNISLYINETQPGSGISSNQPFALWVGQAHSQAALPRPMPIKILAAANEAAAREKQIPLRPLLGVLNQNTPKGDAVLVLIVTWEAAQTKPTP